MTIGFSRKFLTKNKPRPSRLQMPSSSETLHVIIEEEESRSSSSSRVTTPRTARTPYVEAPFTDLHSSKDSQPTELALRPLEVPPPTERSGAISPTSSISPASTCSPLTPTSSDDEFSNLHHVSVKSFTRNETSFIELDSDDDSDSEWYAEELSKMDWPLPPSFPKQLPSWQESLRLEPLPVTRPSSSRSNFSQPRKHNAKEALPPIPARPVLSPNSSIPEIVEPLEPPNPVIKPRSRSRSFRRPPPCMGIPIDCLVDDFLTGEDQSYWSSDFGPAIHHKQPSPAILSPSPRYASSYLTVPRFPDSPGNINMTLSRVPTPRHPYCADLEDCAEVEFAVDDIEFDFNMDMRLPLSLPNTPNDLDTDFVFGLQGL